MLGLCIVILIDASLKAFVWFLPMRGMLKGALTRFATTQHVLLHLPWVVSTITNSKLSILIVDKEVMGNVCLH